MDRTVGSAGSGRAWFDKLSASGSVLGEDGRDGCISGFGGYVEFEGHAGEGARATRVSGNKWRAKKKDSPKWRVTISSGSRMAVRLMRAFQRSNRSMYVDIC